MNRRPWVNHAYKPHMHAHAANFIRNKVRRALNYEKIGIFKRFKINMNRKLNRSYKVGWTAPLAKGAARLHQLRWRKSYFKAHGRVI